MKRTSREPLKRTSQIDLLKMSLESHKGRPDKHNYERGIQNDVFANLIGKITACWPHVEEQMICVLRDLIAGHARAPARHIFRSIISEAVRIKIMTSLLEHSPVNANKGKFYDEVIFAFRELNQKRNEYVHSSWWTRDDNKMFIIKESVQDYEHGMGRQIRARELEITLKKMLGLMHKLRLHGWKLDERLFKETTLVSPELRAEYRRSKKANPNPLFTTNEPQSR
jgi:hypothetical protein